MHKKIKSPTHSGVIWNITLLCVCAELCSSVAEPDTWLRADKYATAAAARKAGSSTSGTENQLEFFKDLEFTTLQTSWWQSLGAQKKMERHTNYKTPLGSMTYAAKI